MAAAPVLGGRRRGGGRERGDHVYDGTIIILRSQGLGPLDKWAGRRICNDDARMIDEHADMAADMTLTFHANTLILCRKDTYDGDKLGS